MLQAQPCSASRSPGTSRRTPRLVWRSTPPSSLGWQKRYLLLLDETDLDELDELDMDSVMDEHMGIPAFPLLVIPHFEQAAPALDLSGPMFHSQIVNFGLGMESFCLAGRHEGALLHLRGASHHWPGGECDDGPTGWETMDRAWGGRRFAVRVPWALLREELTAVWGDDRR